MCICKMNNVLQSHNDTVELPYDKEKKKKLGDFCFPCPLVVSSTDRIYGGVNLLPGAKPEPDFSSLMSD